MIKGCQRRMIVVSQTGSPYFDCAYFVLRCDLPDTPKESDMLKEAYRMIGACEPSDTHLCVPMSQAVKKTEPVVKKRVFLLVALLCAIIPTAATISIFCLFI